MILIKLYLKNFKQYKDQKIQFMEGLTGIIGKNGSGKSSIFEAILLALYGEMPFRKEYLRTSGSDSKDSVIVELEFEIGGRLYRALREFRGKNLNPSGNLYCNEKLIATGQKEVTGEIIKVVGMGKDAFTRSIFAGQKELGAISSATGSDRRLLVRKMVGMDKIDDIQRLIRDDRARVRNEMAGQEMMLLSQDEINKRENIIRGLSEKRQELESEINRIVDKHKEALAAYNAAKKEFSYQQSLYRQYAEINRDLVKANTQYESTEKNIYLVKSKLKKLYDSREETLKLEPEEKEFYEVKKKCTELNEKKNKFIEFEGLLKQIEATGNDISNITVELEKSRNFLNQESDIAGKLSELESDLKKIDSEIEKCKSIQVDLKSEIGKVNELIKERGDSILKIKDAGRESCCPTCLRPLMDAYESTLEKLNGEIEKYRHNELAGLRDKLKKTEKSIDNLNRNKEKTYNDIQSLKDVIAQLNQAKSNMEKLNNEMALKTEHYNELKTGMENFGKIEYDSIEHKSLLNRLDELNHIHEKYLTLNADVKNIPHLENELNEYKNSLDKLDSEKRAINSRLKEIPYSEKKYREAELNQSEKESEKDIIREELNRKKKDILNMDIKVNEVLKELKDDRKRRDFVEKTRNKFVDLDRLNCYMDDFKNAVLEKVRPAIAGYAGNLFQQLTRGRYESIDVDDDFNFYIMDDGQFYPIQRFSGGEIDLANLCLRISIGNAIRDLSGAGSSGFLGFDEIFGSQDRERRFEILNAFNMLQEIYRQIFIISHIDEIKEEFPQILEISGGPSGSTVNMLTNS